LVEVTGVSNGYGVRDYHGLRRLSLTAEAALARPWEADPDGIDIVVVEDPPRERWPELAATGFRVKPRWITWGRRAYADESAFLAGLPQGERRNVRQAQRFVAEQRLLLDVDSELTPDTFAEFLGLYDAQIAAMRHGLPAAHAVPATVAGLADYFFVSARAGGELVAGAMCRLSPREDAVRIAFPAARPDARAGRIFRALYLLAFAEAHRRGFGWISLGSDPTLYGHIVAPGLFTFKSRLGFVPVPLHHLDPTDDGCDEAELVLRTERLSDPAMSLCYARPPDRLATWDDPVPFRLEVLTGLPAPDVRPYRASFVTDIVVRRSDPTQPVVAIVDPMSTGAGLAAEFGRRGWRCVAVLSGTVPPKYAAALRRDDFLAVLPATSIRGLAAHRPAYVIPGCEWGVNLADDLADLLRLPGNESLPDRPRRDKAAMMRRAAAAGLRVPAGAPLTSVEDLDEWLRTAGTLPVVVKPTTSAASDGVHFCDDAEQARAVAGKLLGTTNVLGHPNETLLVQERLVGQQYFVNSVSWEGRHHIHEIWRDDRIFVDGRPVYDRQVLLAAEGEIQDVLVRFVTGVLDALGVRTGPAHTELLVDGDGPVLIECGARLEGGVTSSGPERATGDSQLSLTVERYARPDRFVRRIGTRYARRRALAVVCLVSPCDGVVDGRAVAGLAGLPSAYCGSALELVAGTPVRRTVDLLTSPGHIYLIAEDQAALDRDYARIRELEAGGLYRPSWPERRAIC
jgi:ATP-grasp domain-containing protein